MALEYSCYLEMSLKLAESLYSQLLQIYQSVKHVAFYHRTGRVDVGTPSIVIAVSAPHRREAIDAMEWMLEQVKKQVPIWKREVLQDGSSDWQTAPS